MALYLGASWGSEWFDANRFHNSVRMMGARHGRCSILVRFGTYFIVSDQVVGALGPEVLPYENVEFCFLSVLSLGQLYTQSPYMDVGDSENARFCTYFIELWQQPNLCMYVRLRTKVRSGKMPLWQCMNVSFQTMVRIGKM